MTTTIARVVQLATFIVVICAALAPARAQCPQARLFASVGGGPGQDQMQIDASATENLGNEIGRIWQSDNSNIGNNFSGGCPSSEWWIDTGLENRGIEGFIGAPSCTVSACPIGNLTLLVEDRSPAPYQNAFFVVMSVDETPTPHPRWWDFSTVSPFPFPSVISVESFPKPQVTRVVPGPSSTSVTFDIPDIASGVFGPPASALVQSYDVYKFNGASDPGRNASAWTLVQQIPYFDAAAVGVNLTLMDCPTATCQIAVGLTFSGGDTPVSSMLVGMSVPLGTPGPVPADSAWTMLAMVLLVLTGSLLILRSRRQPSAGH